MSVQEKLVTVTEFEAMLQQPEYQDRRLELIDGEVVETMPTEEHGMIIIAIGTYLQMYALRHRLGRVSTDARHRAGDDTYNDRRPDVSVRVGDNPVVRKGYVMGMPDLAVEVQSPDDSLRNLREKARYYLANGSRLVWIVIPAKQLVEVYTNDEDRILTADDTLDGGEVLPGFSLAVRDIFVDPAAPAE